MTLFELPPREQRKPSKCILQKGSGEFLDWVSEPDFYICYRVGHDFRYAAIISGVIVYTICCLHHYGGYFPDIMNYPAQKDFFGLYQYLINFTGPLFCLALLYYFMWFKKNIDFKEYNILRYKEEKHKNLIQAHDKLHIFFSCLFFIIALRPSILTLFAYSSFTRGRFIPFFDNPEFVFLVAVWVVFIHIVFVQLFFTHTLVTTYIYLHHKKYQRSDS